VQSEAADATWVWRVDDEAMYYDTHDMVRFQVIGEEWNDQTPTGPVEQGETTSNIVAPYRITGTLKHSGLGSHLWWDGQDEEEA